MSARATPAGDSWHREAQATRELNLEQEVCSVGRCGSALVPAVVATVASRAHPAPSLNARTCGAQGPIARWHITHFWEKDSIHSIFWVQWKFPPGQRAPHSLGSGPG